MALLPPAFIAGVLMVFLQVRLRSHCSLATRLVNGLTFFLPPEDELLDKINGRKTKGGPMTPLSPEQKMQQFYVKWAKTEPGVFQQTVFYELYEMLVLLVSSTALACVLGDAFTFAMQWLSVPTAVDAGFQVDIMVYGLVSALLVSLWFPLQIITQGLATYEAKLGLGLAIVGFVSALFVLLAPKGLLAFDMERSASLAGERLEIVLRALGFVDGDMLNVAPVGEFLRALVFGVMALLAAVFVATSFLPAFRFSRMYAEQTTDAQTSRLRALLLHVNMMSPLLVASLWIQKLSVDVFVPTYLVPCASQALVRDCFANGEDELAFAQAKPWKMKESSFHQLRVYVVLVALLVRLLCFRGHLQFFLMEPKDTILQLVRRVGPVDGELLKAKVRIQFNYVPVIAVQYLAPVGATLACVMLWIRQTNTSLGLQNGISVLLVRAFGLQLPQVIATAKSTATLVLPDNTPPDLGGFRLGDDMTPPALAQLVKGMSSFSVITADFHASFFGFFLFWISFTWFLMSLAGLVYWKNVPHLISGDDLQSMSSSVTQRSNKETPKSLKNQLKKLKKH